MTFQEILAEAIAWLQREQRLSYRALKRQFDLSDDYLDDLKEELIYSKRLAVDEEDRVLVWIGATASAPPRPAPPLCAPEREPLAYTPRHLIEKILTTRSSLEGERKQVTVLFCDIANSTPLAERLGPERMHRLLNQFFELALGEVHRYEGTINQFLGDGFMALFGAPIAHEDHAWRAVLTAVSLQRRLHDGATPLGHHDGVDVSTRLGLHTGLVIVGAIGDNLRMDYTAIGDTTNVAARFQSAATPGQIVISEATYRLVEGYCQTHSLGELSLKGKAEPMTAWEVVGVSDSRTRLEVEAARGLTPFVGRERERQLLADCFALAQEGQGQIVLLVGEAGMGKSRFLLECRRQFETDATWLEGHAMSFGRAMAFHPLIDMLKRNFRIEEGDLEETVIAKIEAGVRRLGVELRPIVPYLRYLLAVDPGDAAVQTMAPQLRRAELFEALRRLLLRAAEVRPQVLVFEDLHWMDQATEAFLTSVADSIPTSRVLCIFTYRPGYQHPFGERTYHTRMTLPTLSTGDTVALAQAMLATVDLPEALQRLIVQKAEGNPFFVEELIRSLQEVRDIEREQDRYVLARPLDEIVVPDTIQDVLMARIDRLEEVPKQTLQLASVIGREFAHRLLVRLTDVQDQTEAYLQELKAIELIHEKSLFPELVYMFKHALTQDVAYHSLLEQRRLDLHRLIGYAIEELYADRLAEQYDLLAYHFARGEVWDKALAYFCKAAAKAAQSFAIPEALDLYDQALEAADRLGKAVPGETVMDIHQARAALAYVMSDFSRSRAEAERLLELARQSRDQVREGEALAGIAWASTWSRDLDHAVLSAHQAIEVAAPMEAKAVLARSHFTLGFVHAVTGRHEPAEAALGHALVLSQEAGDRVHRSLACATAGLLKNWTGAYAEASRLQTEGLTIAREHHLLVPLLFSFFLYGITLTGQGSYDEALTLFQEGLTLAEKVGDEAIHHRLLNCLGWLYSELGNVGQALELNQQSAEVGRRRNDPGTLPNAELNLAELFLAQGNLPRAQALLDGMYRYATAPTSSPWMRYRYSIRLYVNLGELWLRLGDLDKAATYADQSLDLATRSQAQKNVVKGWRLKGEIALARRRQDEAFRWLQQALALAETVGNPPQLWKTHLALGRLHTETRHFDMAQQAYQAARTVIDRTKNTLEHPALRNSLEDSPLIQQVYELSASGP